MSPNLDTLSREIAATSNKWATAGVRVFLDGDRSRPVRLMSAEWMVVEDTGRRLRFELTADDRPDLNDDVTVNSLLGHGMVWAYGACGDVMWSAHVDSGAYRFCDRTEAICRAWIAAQEVKP